MWLFSESGFTALSFILPIILSGEEKSEKADGQSLSKNKATIWFPWSDSYVSQILSSFALAVLVIFSSCRNGIKYTAYVELIFPVLIVFCSLVLLCSVLIAS